jgi:hypothetical protein
VRRPGDSNRDARLNYGQQVQVQFPPKPNRAAEQNRAESFNQKDEKGLLGPHASGEAPCGNGGSMG